MNYYDAKLDNNSQKYNCWNLDKLFCARSICESTDIDLGEDFSIYEGSPVLCDSELIGFVSKGILFGLTCS